MKRLLGLIFLLITPVLCLAELPPTSYYKGILGKNTKLWMSMHESDNPKTKGIIEGTYYYEKFKFPILLRSTNVSANEVILKEIEDGGGVFELKKVSNTVTGGIWKNFDNAKRITVTLEKTDANSYLAATAIALNELEKSYAKKCEIEDGTAKVTVRPTTDLNGDSIKEINIACSSLCGATGNCPYLLYLSKDKSLFNYAGNAAGVGATAEKEKHFGLPDLNVYWKGGCVGYEGAGSIFEYDGTEYRDSGKNYKCDCDAAKEKNRSIYCPRWEN